MSFFISFMLQKKAKVMRIMITILKYFEPAIVVEHCYCSRTLLNSATQTK